MTEYFKDPNQKLVFYKFEDDGKLFQLDIVYGIWENVSDYTEYSPKWEIVTEEYIDRLRLFIYVEQSNKYFQEHKKEIDIGHYDYGRNFDFYITSDGVVAVDDRNDGYKCLPDLMLPMIKKIDKIPEDWSKLKIKNAIDYIENQEGIFLSDMELYYDQNGDIQGFTKDLKQFCLSIKTGQLNEVYGDIGIDPEWKECSLTDPVLEDKKNETCLTIDEYDALKPLHNYLLRSEKYYNKTKHKLPYGKVFTYYENPFGQIFSVDENGTYYQCDFDSMKVIENRKDVEDCIEISRFYVMESIAEYEQYKELLPTMKITMRQLINLQDPKKNIYGISEDGRKFKLSKTTGELDEIETIPTIDESWKILQKKEALKIQGKYRLKFKSKKSE